LLLIFTKTQKKYQPKSAKKISLFHRNVKKTKKIFFIAVLSFFYVKNTKEKFGGKKFI
jgi:hypothetical protein